MAKNKRSSDRDSDLNDLTSPKRSRGKPRRAPPLYKARVIETADSYSVRVHGSTEDLDENILVRMKKCLARANHPETTEAEAKAALFMASKLMKTYNVTTAEVLAHETPEAQRNYAGSSTVAIERRDGDLSKKVIQNDYIPVLCQAMEAFFGCDSYTTKSGMGFFITFYGIAEKSVAASNAFEMVYNLIVEWARPYKGQSGTNSYCHGISEELWARAKKEQREEERRAKQAERDARLAQEKQEQVDDQARLSRLHELRTTVEHEQEAEASGTPDMECHQAVHDTFWETQDMFSSGDEDSAGDDSEEYEEWNGFSDDEDEEPNEAGVNYVAADFDDDDEHGYENVWHGDIDQEIDRLVSTMKPADAIIPSAKPLDIPHDSEKTAAASNDTRRDSVQNTADVDDNPQWKSHMQLVKFRETTKQIAADYLQKNNIQLGKGKAPRGPNDMDAFEKGRKDSRKIDVRRKTIAASSKDEREQAGSLLLALS